MQQIMVFRLRFQMKIDDSEVIQWNNIIEP